MAYTTATLTQKDPPGADGRTRIIVTFTGNAGEPAVLREHYVDNDTLADLKAWARTEAATLLGRKSIADLLNVGAALDLTPPAGPSAAQLAEIAWLDKARRLQRAKAIGLTNGTAASDINALQADVDATYLTAYLGKL